MMKSVLDVNITMCKRANAPNTCQEVNLLQVLTTEKYRPLADTCRGMMDKEERKEFKIKNVPVVIIGGTFKYRNEDNLIQHSGLLCIDLDGVQDTLSLKQKVCSLPFVAYCGKSISGKGLYAIIPIPISTPEDHSRRYAALETEFIKRFGIIGTIDPAPKNVAAARYVSYDPDAYFNHTAGTFDTLAQNEPKISTVKDYSRYRQNATFKGLALSDYDRVWDMVDKIQAQGLDFCPDYADYWRVASSIANGLGEAGRDAFHAICQYNSKYNYRDADAKYSEAVNHGSGVTLGTFFGMCKDYGLLIKEPEYIPVIRPKKSSIKDAAPPRWYLDMQGVLKQYQAGEITGDQFLDLQDENREQSGLTGRGYVKEANRLSTN